MASAEEIADAGDAACRALEDKHRAREVTLAASRQAIQCCAASIRASQREDVARAEVLASEAAEHLARADDAVATHPDVRNGGYLHDAKKEHAEARLTLVFMQGGHCRHRTSSAWRFPRTSRAWPRPRASFAATCSTASAPIGSSEPKGS